MTGINDVQRYADAIVAMIREDQDDGQVPRSVATWDELDDSVDTEDYFRQAHLPAGTAGAATLRSAVADEVARRLAGTQGGPWSVTWTWPDGRPADIGRTLGYATRQQAETVGQRYLTEHPGTYSVHDS